MLDQELTDQSVISVLPAPRQRTQARKGPPSVQRAPAYHVVIWNDDEHSDQYVIRMVMDLFNHSQAKAFDIAWKVHNEGKAVVTTCHREVAELRCEQIEKYGPDFALAKHESVALISMRATVEEAPQ